MKDHVDHGWIRDYKNLTDTYIFTMYTDHNHGWKEAELWHDDYSHLHTQIAGNANHISIEYEVNSWHHKTWHMAPFNQSDPNDCSWGDGHGFCGHWMNEKAP